MNRILVAFALQQEFAPWRRRHRFRKVANSALPVSVASFGSTEAYVTLVGAGAPGAHHVQDLTTQFTPSVGIVAGLAGGLRPEWRPGDVLAALSVLGSSQETRIDGDPRLIDLAVQCGAKPAPALLTLRRIARTVAEKERLATCADAADMESLPIMERWSARGIPSLALRVILDPVEVPMTCDFEAALDARGRVRITRILAQLARRPQLLPDFLLLARQSHRALVVLARCLDQLLDRFVGQTK